MSKRFSAFPTLLCSAFLLAGCGNKGELFLPPDALLAKELEAASQRNNTTVTDPADDEITDKTKKQTDTSPASPSQ